jgi:flagellar biosynthesis/type III secretory pathway protein FliH
MRRAKPSSPPSPDLTKPVISNSSSTMQTHLIKFHRPLRGVVAIPTRRNPVPAASSAANRTPAPGVTASLPTAGSAKLPATGSSEPDKTATPNTGPPNAALSNVDLQPLLKKIDDSIAQVAGQHNTLQSEFQELAIQLATEIASAVVQYEVTHHETRIRKFLETKVADLAQLNQQQTKNQAQNQAQNQNQSPAPIWVHVNPADYARLQTSLADSPQVGETIELKSDDSVAIGDCHIESKNKHVIAQWQRQLTDISLQLMESLHDARVEPTESIDTIDSNLGG